jgi:hypothetical protein
MKNWKRVVIFGSLGAGVILLASGKRPAGIAAATIGLAALASEYPETFERVWDYAPDYVNRGIEIFQTLSKVVERFAERAPRQFERSWDEAGEAFGG